MICSFANSDHLMHDFPQSLVFLVRLVVTILMVSLNYCRLSLAPGVTNCFRQAHIFTVNFSDGMRSNRTIRQR